MISEDSSNIGFLNLLALDTSGEQISIAILKSGKEELLEREVEAGKSISSELTKLLDQAVREADLNLNQLDGLIVGSGPGSFTGLRVGFAFLKGIAFALKKPLAIRRSLESMCIYDAEEMKLVMVLSDAGREEFFVSLAVGEVGQRKMIVASEILNRESLSSVLREVIGQFNIEQSACTVFYRGDFSHQFCSSGLPPNFSVKRFNRAAKNLLIAVTKDRHFLNAKSDSKGDFLKDLADLTPHYVRKVAAKTLAERGFTT